MSYATRSDLARAYGEHWINQRESVMPVGSTDAALAAAQAEIDTWLAARYALPLASAAPADLVRLTCAVARYRLLGDAVTDAARQDYEDALKDLRAIAGGSKALMGVGGLDANGQAPQGASGLARLAVGRRVFGRSGREA